MRADIVRMDHTHLEPMVAIEADTFPTPWTFGHFIVELSKAESDWFVALEDGRVVGYAGLAQLVGEGHILNIAVRGDRRRLGIGSALMTRIIEAAKERELDMVTLEVRAGNLEAQHLYRKFGLRTVGLRKGYYSDTGEDAVLMTVWLVAGAENETEAL